MAKARSARLTSAPADDVPVHQKVAALRDPAAYPTPVGRIEAVQTHMAWVFLAGERAYKLKKPVQTPVLDFSTLAARRRDGEREVALNRSLAGSVYRRLVPLTRTARGDLSVGGQGRVADWLVEMRRLDAGASLDAAIAAGQVRRLELERAIEWLARFYDAAPPERLSGGAYRSRLARQIEAARDELLHDRFALPRERVCRIAEALLAELERSAPSFERRARRVIDAHGDLRPEHIFLRPLPVIIDCLEFRRDLRVLDPVAELAFLGLECERLGAPWIGGVALATYEAITGDEAPRPIWRFYRAVQALTRAVVALWHLDDPGRRDGAHFRAKALAYLDAASEL
jgi:uncharacterized protein